MNRHLLRLALVLLLALLAAPLATADVPRTVSFQGHLENAGGGSVNGLQTITFRLWDASAGGNELWSEVHVDVPVSNGDFVVSLGSITPFEFRADQPLWLGITVAGDPNGELVPRQAIHSQPSAIITALLEIGNTSYDVDCGTGGSIGAALASPRAYGRLTINISGTCTENVVIRTRKVTINGQEGTNPRILALDTTLPAVELVATQDNVLNEITIDGGSPEVGSAPALLLRDTAQAFLHNVTVTGAGTDGITVTRGSSIRVTDNSTVQGNGESGIALSFGSVGRVDNSTSSGNGQHGIVVVDGSTLLLETSTVEGPASDADCDINSAECDAVALFRGGNANVRYDSTLTATVPGSYALDALYNSQVRVQTPLATTNVINGAVRAGFNSHLELRESTTSGNATIFGNSTFRMRNGATLTGDITLGSMSGMFSNNPFTVTGNVNCEFGRSAAYIDFGNVTGGSNGSCTWTPNAP